MTQPPLPPTTPPQPQTPRKTSWREALAIPLGLVGAILGALVGGFVFRLLESRGLLAPFVVGVFVGIGTRWLARTGNGILAAIAFVIAIIGSITAEWAGIPADRSVPLLEYFLHPLQPQHFNSLGWVLAFAGACAAAFLTYAAPPRLPRA
jgi:hypothetical protein